MTRIAGPNQKASRFITLASVCVVVAALYFAQDVFVPLALAILLSFLLTPIVRRLEQWRLGRVPSVLITVALVFGLVLVFGYVVGLQLLDLADNVDRYKENIASKIDAIKPRRDGLFKKVEDAAAEVQKQIEADPASTTQSTQATSAAPEPPSAAGGIGRASRSPRSSDGSWTTEKPLPVSVVSPPSSPMTALSGYLGLALAPLGTFAIVIVFVIFMLLQREDLRNRVIRLTTGSGRLAIATQALDDASSRISRYLLAQAIVNGTYGAAIAIALWLVGITVGRADASGTDDFPNVILWGLLCALLRFIPYVGPWIAAAFPLLVSLAVYKGFAVFGVTVGIFIVIELLSNNVMEPLLYGSSTGISTIAVLVSAVFWTWLWGPIGLLLSTPITSILVVLGKYVPQMAFLDVLLGDEPVLTPPARLYQRLLALDADEAGELARSHREQAASLAEVYDQVMVPALAMAERDRHTGQLDERREQFIVQSMREMVEELGDEERARGTRQASTDTVAAARGQRNANDSDRPAVIESETATESPVQLVCLPAADPADEIVSLMLAQVLELQGYRVQSISQDALASEMLERVEQAGADLVLVSALPPAAVAHARYLCKRVTGRFPQLPLIVGLWTVASDRDKLKRRACGEANATIVTTLAEAQAAVSQVAQPGLTRGTTPRTETRARGNDKPALAATPSSPRRRP